MTDRDEVNVQRLLARCTLMANGQLTVLDAKRLLRFTAALMEQVRPPGLGLFCLSFRWPDVLASHRRLPPLHPPAF